MEKHNLSDELLQGSIDMHCHAYPEFSNEFPNRYTTAEHIRLMADAGMGGVVLKSHFWPSLCLAAELRRQFPDFPIFGSITINDGVGGMEPWVVEAAAKLDAKVVWLYTWSAQNDVDRRGISSTIGKYIPSFGGYIQKNGKRLVGEDGALLPAVAQVLEVCRDYGLVVCTGHVSIDESLAVARAAADMGLEKLILTHPDSNSVCATDEQIAAFARLGGYVELCSLGLTPIHYRVTPARFAKIVRSVGAERCVASTDYFFEWSSSSPEQMRGLISVLLFAGVSPEEVRTITSTVPRRLLGMN